MSDRQLLKNCIYEDRLLGKAANSQLSFHEIDTPGWSSMVKTDTASDMRPRSSWNNNDEIESRFNGKDISNLTHKTENINNKQCLRVKFSHQTENSKSSIKQFEDLTENKLEKKQGRLSLCERIELRLKESKQENGNNFKLDQSSMKSQKSLNFQSYGTRNSVNDLNHQKFKIKKNQKKSATQSTSRFKEITVHQHLYQVSKKIQKKKEVYRIIEEKYQKQFITPFHPQIDAKSNIIAIQKFNSCQKIQSKVKEVESNSKENKKKSPVEQSDEVIIDFFECLSLKSQQITEKTLNEALQQLPLSCFCFLEKIIKNVYKGVNYPINDFKLALNDKRLISNKSKLLKAFENYKKTHTEKIPPFLQS